MLNCIWHFNDSWTCVSIFFASTYVAVMIQNQNVCCNWWFLAHSYTINEYKRSFSHSCIVLCVLTADPIPKYITRRVTLKFIIKWNYGEMWCRCIWSDIYARGAIPLYTLHVFFFSWTIYISITSHLVVGKREREREYTHYVLVLLAMMRPNVL